MNSNLLQQFYAGEIIIQIGSNEQANELLKMTENDLEVTLDNSEIVYKGNDFSKFPYLAIRHDYGEIFADGWQPSIVEVSRIPVINYTELYFSVPGEVVTSDIELEEVL